MSMDKRIAAAIVVALVPIATVACSSAPSHPAAWKLGYDSTSAVSKVGWSEVDANQDGGNISTVSGGLGAVEYALRQDDAASPLSFPLDEADATQVCSDAMLASTGGPLNATWNDEWNDGCIAAFKAEAKPDGL